MTEFLVSRGFRAISISRPGYLGTPLRDAVAEPDQQADDPPRARLGGRDGEAPRIAAEVEHVLPAGQLRDHLAVLPLVAEEARLVAGREVDPELHPVLLDDHAFRRLRGRQIEAFR